MECFISGLLELLHTNPVSLNNLGKKSMWKRNVSMYEYVTSSISFSFASYLAQINMCSSLTSKCMTLTGISRRKNISCSFTVRIEGLFVPYISHDKCSTRICQHIYLLINMTKYQRP
jgi:hypothetical protein